MKIIVHFTENKDIEKKINRIFEKVIIELIEKQVKENK